VRAPRLRPRRGPLPRLAGRAHPAPAEDQLRPRSLRRRRPLAPHDPQPQLPGRLPRHDRARHQPHPRRPPVPSGAPARRPGQLPAPGHPLRRRRVDGQPDLRSGDPDPGPRRRPRRVPPRPLVDGGRHLERRRLRRVVARARSPPAGALQRQRSPRQGAVQAGAARVPRPALRARRAGGRHRLAAGRAEGLRPGRPGRAGAPDPPRLPARRPGQRRARPRGDVHPLAARVPAPGLLLPGLPQPPGPPHRGRRRSVPHAVALRAVRPEPDVQPALRHAADRPQDRRPGRHRAALAQPDPDRHRLRLRAPRRRRLRWALQAALATYRDAPAWSRLVDNGMAVDFSWERQTRRYEFVYDKLVGRAP
jgi:hypothetical protein